jgi:outer membrane lipoprotein carrier protein
MESAIRESEDLRAPLAFLLGRLDFDEQFGRYESSRSLTPLESGNTIFKAYPKRLGERLEWVLFEINPQSQIRRIVVREIGGQETEFRFQQETENPPLRATLFQFTPPPGAAVIRE